ncbi:MAG: OmpA family protein [Thioalkalivibrionaceae bacterium]
MPVIEENGSPQRNDDTTASVGLQKQTRRLVHHLKIVALAILSTLCLSATANDAVSIGDHPLVPRIANSILLEHHENEFVAIKLPSGPLANARAPEYESELDLEGHWEQRIYGFENDASLLRIHRSYLETLPLQGFEILFEASDSDLVNQRARPPRFFGAMSDRYLVTHRGPMSVSSSHHYILARHRSEPVVLAIAAYERPRDGTTYTVNVLTEEAMTVEMTHTVISASEIEDTLIREGRIALQGIRFAFDSDEILPESREDLAEVGNLMRDRPELSILIVGHTDHIGDFDYNLRLSMTRAQTVERYLQSEYGIAARRLRAAGAGMISPIATNRTEAGRADNRRVELVEIPRD